MATKTAKARAGIETLRSIVEHHQHARLNFEDGPTMAVDAFSANAMLTVHDALSPENQAGFERQLRTRRGFMRMHQFSLENVH